MAGFSGYKKPILQLQNRFLCFYLLSVHTPKIGYYNTANRAILFALSAICAFFVINSRKIIFYRYSADRTTLFTFFAAYTAVRALVSDHSSLFCITARNKCCLDVGNNAYYPLRTSPRAKTAANTSACIYVRYSVFNTNCLVRANIHTITKSKTAK